MYTDACESAEKVQLGALVITEEGTFAASWPLPNFALRHLLARKEYINMAELLAAPALLQSMRERLQGKISLGSSITEPP